MDHAQDLIIGQPLRARNGQQPQRPGPVPFAATTGARDKSVLATRRPPAVANERGFDYFLNAAVWPRVTACATNEKNKQRQRLNGE